MRINVAVVIGVNGIKERRVFLVGHGSIFYVLAREHSGSQPQLI
jgi:hypothetical protein